MVSYSFRVRAPSWRGYSATRLTPLAVIELVCQCLISLSPPASQLMDPMEGSPITIPELTPRSLT